MTDSTLRSVSVERTATGHFTAVNADGDRLAFGTAGDGFTPVELLLAAIGGCTMADVDVATSRHAEPDRFTVTVTGHKISDENGNRMTDLEVTFSVAFPQGEGGDRARAILPRAIKSSHDRLCTVSRTVETGTPVRTVVTDA
ncbi:osmotically inducible protein C [Streptomyces sp. NBRC 14336]|uniref:OsmC family protein n=1 Tax=Streptomyces sp. NBRC 14336 TaxID=3030992 RepID=UPI0024A57EAC|nr:OsmC family protein [Streptomyces sp. NBRC 14336]WBO82090.1 OsmC family protein [Streptomyces sp. SBE_14.2]GLW47361.1 osmotically inducible protein C [Streptomyces sp. NBRC 14336]